MKQFKFEKFGMKLDLMNYSQEDVDAQEEQIAKPVRAMYHEFVKSVADYAHENEIDVSVMVSVIEDEYCYDLGADVCDAMEVPRGVSLVEQVAALITPEAVFGSQGDQEKARQIIELIKGNPDQFKAFEDWRKE